MCAVVAGLLHGLPHDLSGSLLASSLESNSYVAQLFVGNEKQELLRSSLTLGTKDRRVLAFFWLLAHVYHVFK